MKKYHQESVTITSPLTRHWEWLLGLGIIFVLLGGLGLGTVVSITLASMFFLGILLIIAGTVQCLDIFQCKRWNAKLYHAFIALLYLIAGALIIYDPLLASTLITGCLAILLIVIGITRLVMAWRLRETKGWFWIVLSGLLACALGLIILSHWPWSGLWFIGLLITIELLITGWTYIFLALAARSH